MTIISRRILTPILGKSDLVLKRAKSMQEIMTNHGAKARVARIVAGDLAGSIHLTASYENMENGCNSFNEMSQDPARIALMKERQDDPGGHLIGPEVFRTIYGNISPEHNVIMMREYQLSRDNMSEAVQIFPEIDAILKDEDASFMAVVPLLATNMDRLIACYYFRDMSSMGEQIDRVGMSEEFQKIVLKASNAGTLISSRVLLNI